VVKSTCYFSDEAHRFEAIEAYRQAFAPGPYPARCSFTLGLAGDCRVQIEVVAAAPGYE
jgi:2-iminobutanoate/2-iminopropanoate deaminase